MIRRAVRTDAPAMLAMARALAQESPKYRDKDFDESKLMALAERLQGTLLVENAAILVDERAGELVGMMIVVLAERFFGGDMYVTDLTLYVKPEHRGGTSFARLVQTAETWARKQGVRDAAFGVSTEINAEATVHAYQRMGYTLSGYTLTKTLNHGD